MALIKAMNSGAPVGVTASDDLPPDLGGLYAMLGDAVVGVRRRAARDLALHPAAAPRIAAHLLQENDASVRAVLFTSLTRIGGDAAVDGVLPLLRSEDAALRNGAIELLAGLPDAVVPRIEALLNDADSDVRIFSVNLLGLLPHPRVPQWLSNVLSNEGEPNVIGAALEVLAEVGGPEMQEPLRRIRARFPDDPFIAFAVDLTLQRTEPS